MKTKKIKTPEEIKAEIESISCVYRVILNTKIEIKGVKANFVSQIDALARLRILYWTLGEDRPKFKCDESI